MADEESGVVTTNDLIPSVQGDWRNWKTNGRFKETKIKDGVSIGANSTIICGVTLNEGAFIGAGSVVTKDAESGYLYYGNPAKKIRKK